MSNIVKNGLLRKKFDYTHTGLNTEVLGFDITLNNTYYQLQALNHGISGRADDIIPGFSQLNEELQDILARKSEFDKRLRKLDAQIADLQKQIELENLKDFEFDQGIVETTIGITEVSYKTPS